MRPLEKFSAVLRECPEKDDASENLASELFTCMSASLNALCTDD